MPLQTGEVLNNRYRIVKLLGRGGFGAVYKVWDLNMECPRALKENLDTTPEAQKQFKVEAKILGKLKHQNLTLVIDHFIIPGQGQYLVMEYVEGQDLQEMLDKQGGPLPENQVLPWIEQVCDALGYLHSQNPPIIHRDIKPANIKITPDGRAMLVDFGIAKMFNPLLSTTVGARAVTPGYSPHEQYGQGKTDSRTDIYALGATLYTLLTGQVPVESINRVIKDPLLPPEQVNPRISLGVADCIHQAMHPDPARRHKDAVHFKSALQTLPPIVSTLPLPQPAATQPSAPKALNFKTLRLKRFINWPIWARGVGIAGLFGLALLVIYTIRNIQPPSTPEQTSLAEVMTQTEMAAEAQPTITPMVPVLPVPTISPAPPLPSETFPATPTRTEAPTSRPTSLLTATSKPIVGLDSTQVSTTEVSATQISPKDNMVLVYIPAGAFEMGSEEGQSDENPVHTISLDAFWMDQHEVTLAQFKKFILEESYEANLCVGYDDHPVTCVIWYDALAYCDWAGRRLPTEAEWEKAARGGLTGARYPWGDEDPVCTSNAQNGAQYHECSDHAVSVMTFPPNGYGLYDMAGNVWEWVFDWYDSDYYGNSPTNNPQGPSSGNYRILRGGSWRNSGNLLRVAFRLDYNPVTSYNYIGFRCALSP